MRGGLERRAARGRLALAVVTMLFVSASIAAVKGAEPLTAAEKAAIAAEYADLAPLVVPQEEPAEAAAEAAVEPTPVGALARTFAVFDGLEIGLPSPNVLLIGFHEAANRSALPQRPAGRLLTNENAWKVTAPADVLDGPGYLVLSSRGRSMPGTSAVDLVMRDDEDVMAPVSGTVTNVQRYALYGRYPDHLIEIQPAGRPDLRVVLIHIVDVAVSVGDEVEAGRTLLAGGPNRFSFTSHIDEFFPKDRWPHVHLEVQVP